MEFQPDYRHIEQAAWNKKPERLPVYEHQINNEFIEKIVGKPIVFDENDPSTMRHAYRLLCGFWKQMTYDTISFEGGICPILPDHGAIYGGRPGPIQSWDDFNKFPWDEIPEIFWNHWTPHLEALKSELPAGMKALGGCGNGVFEISEDLVGYERLCLLIYDEPDLVAALYQKIGDLMVDLWTDMLQRYGDLFAVCRMGDDLGYKFSTMLQPDFIRKYIIPQYKRVIDIVHTAGKPFLLHSCGNIFSVMDEIVAAGINAKHSNEDIIAPFETWIEKYSKRIGLFGGIDMNILCFEDPKSIREYIFEKGSKFRQMANGFALGSGNSIPDYIPVDGYLAMIEAANDLRKVQ